MDVLNVIKVIKLRKGQPAGVNVWTLIVSSCEKQSYSHIFPTIIDVYHSEHET